MNIGSRIYIRLVYHAVCSNSNPEACFREGMYKSSEADAQLLLDKVERWGSYLIAPAAVLGPNH
jgi:hypothetical protein